MVEQNYSFVQADLPAQFRRMRSNLNAHARHAAPRFRSRAVRAIEATSLHAAPKEDAMPFTMNVNGKT
jgi:hypothetical protein